MKTLLLSVILLSSCATYTSSQAIIDANTTLSYVQQFKALKLQGKPTTEQKLTLVKQYVDAMLKNHPSSTADQIKQYTDFAYNAFELLAPAK